MSFQVYQRGWLQPANALNIFRLDVQKNWKVRMQKNKFRALFARSEIAVGLSEISFVWEPV